MLHLVDKSLILMDEHSAETRYHMLETIREYARDRLQESGEADKAQRQHLDFFLQFAEAGGAALWPSDEYSQWGERMELELDNLRAALGWSLENDVKAGLQLAGLFGKFTVGSLHYREGLNWLRTFLALPESSPRTLARAQALLLAGTLENESFQQTRGWFEESLAIYRELGDPAGIADALGALGWFVKNDADYWESARELLFESLQISEILGDKHRAARALSFLGQDFLIRGDTVQARRLCEESVRIYRELGMKHGLAVPLGILGNLAFGDGDLVQARVCYEESLALYREMGNEQNGEWMLLNLSEVAARQGSYSEARDLIETALTISSKYGWNVGRDICSMAFLIRAQGDYQQASKWYLKSLPLLKIDPLTGVRALEGLADTWAMQGKTGQPVQLFGAADALRITIKYPLSALRRAEVERDLAVLRTALSEEVFTAAWNAGQAMTLEQAIAYALNDEGLKGD